MSRTWWIKDEDLYGNKMIVYEKINVIRYDMKNQ